MNVPVAFLVYNRPDLTRRAFESIRARRPSTLIVVADGPRDKRDVELCAETRRVIDSIDWPCDLHTDYADKNLGCAVRVASGISNVFARWDAAIIIEDDCVADASFFRYAEEMLERYAGDPRVFSVSANNFQFGRGVSDDSYYFSRYPHCWGWATWSRAWAHYDRGMAAWPQLSASGWLETFLDGDSDAVRYWRLMFDRVFRGEVDTWDYAWFLTCWQNAALTVIPRTNLVTNIGFSPGATHTIRRTSALANIATEALTFPLKHPAEIQRNVAADRRVEKFVFERQHALWLHRAAGAMRKLVSKS
jgi:hypothetical protein